MHMHQLTATKIFVSASVLLLCLSAYSLIAVGPLAFFLIFHQPLGWPAWGVKNSKPATLPTFSVTSSLTESAVSPGTPQSITLKITPNTSVTGDVEVWAESPENKQLFQSNVASTPTAFTKNRTSQMTFTFTPTNKWPAGIYKVGEIITSPDSFTDYYVHTNALTFNLT